MGEVIPALKPAGSLRDNFQQHLSGNLPNGTGLQFTVKFGGHLEQALIDGQGTGIVAGRRAESGGEGDQFRRFINVYRVAEAPQDRAGIRHLRMPLTSVQSRTEVALPC